jgi:CheY-like chemotaxis protein
MDESLLFPAVTSGARVTQDVRSSPGFNQRGTRCDSRFSYAKRAISYKTCRTAGQGPYDKLEKVRIPQESFAEAMLDTAELSLEAQGVNDVADAASEHGTVLIVDDDEEIRHILRFLCEDEGLEVIGEAGNGVEAVPLALRHQPDFVILDYMLPRLDGEGAAEIMRAVSPGSKIVAFSALLQEQPPWADAYLNKERITELMPLLQTFIR